jgi:hypothetical protein
MALAPVNCRLFLWPPPLVVAADAAAAVFCCCFRDLGGGDREGRLEIQSCLGGGRRSSLPLPPPPPRRSRSRPMLPDLDDIAAAYEGFAFVVAGGGDL